MSLLQSGCCVSGLPIPSTGPALGCCSFLSGGAEWSGKPPVCLQVVTSQHTLWNLSTLLCQGWVKHDVSLMCACRRQTFPKNTRVRFILRESQGDSHVLSCTLIRGEVCLQAGMQSGCHVLVMPF